MAAESWSEHRRAAIDAAATELCEQATDSRSERKRTGILTAATELFLRNGYQGTSMDEIASVASVSKQTVYKNFADKQTLFTAIVLGTLDRFGEPFLAAVDRLKDTENLETDLVELARGYLAAIMRPQVLRLRRLIIAEADRLPELARTYYERAPERTIAALADCFAQLATRGLLSVDDPLAAAGQFAFLVLGQPLDRALFCLSDKGFREADHNAHTDAGVRVFLAAYRP